MDVWKSKRLEEYVEQLEKELDRAVVVAPREVPADVVPMNPRAHI